MGGRLFEFEWEWEGWGGDGRLFEAGCLFEVGANSRLGAYLNKYGNSLSLQMVQKNHENLK